MSGKATYPYCVRYSTPSGGWMSVTVFLGDSNVKDSIVIGEAKAKLAHELDVMTLPTNFHSFHVVACS